MKDHFHILEKIVRDHSDYSRVLKILDHCRATGEIAGDIARKLGLNIEEAVVAGYFHDIGKCFAKDTKEYAFHEIIGARYIEEEGFEFGIAHSKEQCDRIAQSIRSHFVVYEQFTMPAYDIWLSGLKDTNPALLLPRSWNEVIIIYADLTNADGKAIAFETRLTDIKKRDRDSGSLRLSALESAEPRLEALRYDLEQALSAGQVSSKYICL